MDVERAQVIKDVRSLWEVVGELDAVVEELIRRVDRLDGLSPPEKLERKSK